MFPHFLRRPAQLICALFLLLGLLPTSGATQLAPAQPQNISIVNLPPQGSWLTPCQNPLMVGGNPTKACPTGPLWAQSGFANLPLVGQNDRVFKALHLALIPQPADKAGLVLGFDSQSQSGNWSQRWVILNPATNPPTVLWNDEFIIPDQGVGNLFCSGHAWMPDGRLFVAGGTSQYGSPFGGAKLALVFDPADPSTPYGNWTVLDQGLEANRWYPTVNRLPDGKMMVLGGTHAGGAQNSYEVYDPITGLWDTSGGSQILPGPLGSASVGNYPRLHTLSDGYAFVSGPKTSKAKVRHTSLPGSWINLPQSSVVRHDGASILFPRNFGNQDKVWILGGASGGHSNVHQTVESVLPKGAGTWGAAPSMKRKRVHLNAVLLPDKSVLVVGGNDTDAAGNPILWRDAEWYSRNQWFQLLPGDSGRDYHSSAALLPNGNVLSAGGDRRDWDYQVLRPPYFDRNRRRPKNVTLSSSQLHYLSAGGGPYTATFNALPDARSILRAVLLAPASTTHHSDMGQRFVDLEILSKSANSVTFNSPFNSCLSPNSTHSCATPGYYMLFLVTDQGVPSVGRFVHLK